MDKALVVTVPQETVNDQSVRLLSWKVTSGSHVEKDRLICEVETSKAVMEMAAPEGGTVEYWAAVGEEIPVGSVIFQIVAEGQQPAPNILVPIELSAGLNAPVSQLPPARLTTRALAAADEYGVDRAFFPAGTLVRRDDVVRRAADMARAVFPPATSVPKSGKQNGDSRPRNTPVIGVPIDWVELPRRKDLEGRILRKGRVHCIQSSITSSFRARGLRARMDKKSTLHFSTLFFTTSTVFRTMGVRSRADIATRGFAISFTTSARVALSCCSFVFLLCMTLDLGSA